MESLHNSASVKLKYYVFLCMLTLWCDMVHSICRPYLLLLHMPHFKITLPHKGKTVKALM